MATCSLAGWLTVVVAVCAGDPGDEQTGTGPRTYLPNSKQSPLAPTFVDVSYGEHERNKLDFWQAESGTPTPVVMILHGGGWTAGSKVNVPRRSAFPNIRALLGNGISVVAIDYRLIGKHMKEWFPNAGYGGHAFGKKDFAEFLADRESLLPWIAEYSPCALVSAGDPPVCLFYGSKPPALGVPSDAIHGANFGIGLQQRCTELEVECHVVYTGAPNVKYKSPLEYLIAALTAPAAPEADNSRGEED